MDLAELLVAPLRYPFMQRAVLAVVVLGALCAVLGCFVVLRHLTFIGEGLAHGSLAGLALGYGLGADLYLAATLFAMGLAALIGYLGERGRLAMDVAIGILFSTAAAAGILLLSRMRLYADLNSYLFGSVLGVSDGDIRLIVGGGLGLLLLVALLYKELLALSFDRELTAVTGVPTRALHYALLLMIAVTVVLAMQTVGLILVTALLVIPAAAALQLCDRLERAIVLATAVGVVGGVVGLYLSYYLRAASGASIVLTVAALFLVCFLLGRRRRATLAM
jgi:manganese/iron transport system permease protein